MGDHMTYARGRTFYDADSHLMELSELMGLDKQLVFSRLAATQFMGDDSEMLCGGARAHNRAMADFCVGDDRLIAVGFAPRGDPQRTAEEAREAIRLGCGAIFVRSARAAGVSMPESSEDDRERFHPGNFADMMQLS